MFYDLCVAQCSAVFSNGLPLLLFTMRSGHNLCKAVPPADSSSLSEIQSTALHLRLQFTQVAGRDAIPDMGGLGRATGAIGSVWGRIVVCGGV